MRPAGAPPISISKNTTGLAIVCDRACVGLWRLERVDRAHLDATIDRARVVTVMGGGIRDDGDAACGSRARGASSAATRARERSKVS